MTPRRWCLALGPSILLAGCDLIDASRQYEDYSLLGKPVPQFMLDGVAYPPQNDVVLIEFWGLWCADCLYDAPHTARLRQAFAQEPRVSLLAIHGGEYGRWASIAAYFEETGDPFETLDDPAYELSDLFELEWFPSYILVDRSGTIVHMQTTLSRRDGEQRLVEAVRDLLDP